jgi:hypothetical protein
MAKQRRHVSIGLAIKQDVQVLLPDDGSIRAGACSKSNKV